MAKSSLTVPTDLARGLEHDVVVGGVGNRAARGDRGEPRAAPAAQHAVHRVAVQVRGAMAAARAEAFREHAHHGEVLVARQASRTGYARVKTSNSASSPHSRAATSATICWARTSSGLGGIATRSSSPRRTASSSAVHSTSSSRDKRKQPRLGLPADRVTGAPRALQEGRDRARRAELADQLDVADVDAELERSGGHERPQFAALQALLGVEVAAPWPGCRGAR